jgi:hypothetical protein
MKSTILPINTAPTIYNATHHTYPCSIIESKELTHLQIKDYALSKWNYITSDMTISLNTTLFPSEE